MGFRHIRERIEFLKSFIKSKNAGRKAVALLAVIFVFFQMMTPLSRIQELGVIYKTGEIDNEPVYYRDDHVIPDSIDGSGISTAAKEDRPEGLSRSMSSTNPSVAFRPQNGKSTAAPAEVKSPVISEPVIPAVLNPASPVQDPEDAGMPAQSFSGKAGSITITVDADEDTFPAGTRMGVKTVSDQSVIDSVTECASADTGHVEAIDITFYDRKGNEIEPLKPVRVSMVSDMLKNSSDAQVVHVDNTGNAESVASDPSSVGDGGISAVNFSAGSFSVYALVIYIPVDEPETEATDETAEGPAVHTRIYEGPDFTVTMSYGDEALIPEDSVLAVYEIEPGTDSYKEHFDAAAYKLGVSSRKISEARFFDIRFEKDGVAIEPLASVKVNISYNENSSAGEDDDVSIVHFGEEEAEIIETEESSSNREISFVSEDFSVYSVIYTVDFRWDVDGNSYTYGFPGGSFARMSDLAEALMLAGSEDTAEDFISDIADVSFSDPDLVWTGRADTDTTIGDLREEYAPDTVYSSDLTEEEILEINSLSVAEGDWVLIGLKPFTTEETLTVTMKDGEMFTVGVTDAQITGTILTADGETYEVTITYDDEAGIPDGSTLEVSEITADQQEYAGLMSKAESALNVPEGAVEFARFFDIKIVDPYGTKITIESPVEVSIRLADDSGRSYEDAKILHYEDGNSVPVLVERGIDEDEPVRSGEDVISFSAGGFSVYAIVDAPDPATVQLRNASDLSVIAAEDEGFMLYIPGKGYFLTTLNNKGALNLTGNHNQAAVWYLEIDDNSDAIICRIYTMDGNQRKYLYNTKDNEIGFTDSAASAGQFEITQAADSCFYIKLPKAYSANDKEKWLQYSNGGSGIRFWTDNNNADNSRVYFTLVSSTHLPDDVYGLDGNTFGIAYNDDSTNAAGLSTAASEDGLAGDDLLIRRDVLDNDGLLLASDKDEYLINWTFESAGREYYYIKTVIDGTTYYLTVNDDGSLAISTQKDTDRASFKAVPGTGSQKGKWHFSANGKYINFNTSQKRFKTGNSNVATSWLNLVSLIDPDVLDSGDFTYYSARKVSVSDVDNMHDGALVVMYTRLWNDETHRYEFYVVDHDGTLIRCYDTGDGIEWVGSDINTAEWLFTEYHYSDGTPNYYYDLQNVQYGNYLSPQFGEHAILSDTAPGINMTGRRYGYNDTTIIAWNNKSYSYSGLRVEGNRVVACSLDDAEEFYFAIITGSSDPSQTETPAAVSTVETVDNSQYGITMKMIDYNGQKNGKKPGDDRDLLQDNFFGGDNNKPGLLSTNLIDGYPVSTSVTGNAGISLGKLFSNDQEEYGFNYGTNYPIKDVNHLFIKSIYNESGYFEYDSTENFAHLNDDNGFFTVYDQLGNIGDYNSSYNSNTHGQFMPYDDIVDEDGNPKPYSIYPNTHDVLGRELPDTDARKWEKIHNIGNRADVDYHFGMEMSASFTQTADGLDAWGHDIIFEFSGDDDFWFYVDGELVLDLGGVHSAMAGSVNFRTGEVKGRTGNTTLYDIFKSNYENRYTDLTDTDIEEMLADIFEEKTVDGKTVKVFKDYSEHEMKVFYMERGCGASNLHMRFNLAAVRPGTFVLSKKLSGTDSSSNDVIEFPYQIWYTSQKDNETLLHLLGEIPGEENMVHYSGTSRKVKYSPSFIPSKENGTVVDGEIDLTDPEYDYYYKYRHVFFLKPGESAEVQLPDMAVDYYVVECGVDPDIYDVVRINGEKYEGEQPKSIIRYEQKTVGEETVFQPVFRYVSDTERLDYITDPATLEKRKKVEYDNHVAPGAMQSLEITKRLYDSDGTTRLNYPEDPTLFSYRLYLGDENADPNSLPYADKYRYFVKDPDGYYCFWDSDAERFRRIHATVETVDGKEVYTFIKAVINAEEEDSYLTFKSYNDDTSTGKKGLKNLLAGLSNADKDSILFPTSMNGSISGIPADYTVEVRDLIASTQWKVEERESEIPRGYTLRLEDGYQRVDTVPVQSTGTTPITGTIETGIVPKVVVSNQKGWGLTVEKVWTDSDFMESHDQIFFGVFVKESNGEYQIGDTKYNLVPGTVRRLSSSESSLYYFFGNLQQRNFNDYDVFEVILSGDSISVDANGYASGYSTVTPIPDEGTMTIGGKPVNDEYHANAFTYTALYKKGAITTQNENVRTDTVTNSRPGIELYKEDLASNRLGGAVFTLTGPDGSSVAADSFTSRNSDGLITTAYLAEGITYTLTETAAPKEYIVLDEPFEFSIFPTAGGYQLVCEDNDLISVSYDNPLMQATVIIRDRTTGFVARKIDEEGHPLSGVHFALYPQVKDVSGNLVKDRNPVESFDDIVTDENGILPGIDFDLKPGTYYLTETQTLSDYDLLASDICFTVGSDGTVTLVSGCSPEWLVRSEDEDSGIVSYTLSIRNTRSHKVSFRKVDLSDRSVLQGAVFDMYKKNSDGTLTAIYTGLVSGSDGTLAVNGQSQFVLRRGDYVLIETTAPNGYYLKSEHVTVHVTDQGVTYEEGTDLPSNGGVITGEDGSVTILISNTHGSILPEAGGRGTYGYTVLGLTMILIAAWMLFIRRKNRLI